MENIYVNCEGNLEKRNSKKEVMDFYEKCIYGSEGSERERYINIYFATKLHFYDNQRCFTDGTDRVYRSNIDPKEVSSEDEKLLIKYFNINKIDLMKFKVDNFLSKRNSRIHEGLLKEHGNIENLYNNYINKTNEVSFYILKDDCIVCIDATANPPDNYWMEEFPLEDYKYADMWLGQDIEYTDYLEQKKKDNQELKI